MTATSEIPNLPDGSVLPIFGGKIERVFPVSTSKPGAKRDWKKQAFLVSSPSGKVLVETFTQSLFVTEAEIGKDFQWYSSATAMGYLGITKKSYTTKPKEGDDPNTFVPEKKHSVFLDKGTRLTPPSTPQPATPMPPPIAPPAPMEQAPAPHPKSMLPAPSNAITRLAKQWRMCFEATKAVNPEFSVAELLPPTATVFIEAQRSGVKEFAAKEPAPASGNDAAPKQEPVKPEPETQKPAAVKPKFTVAQLAAKIDAGEKVKPSDLDGVPLRALWDWVFAEAKHTIGLKYLDAAFLAARERHKTDDKLYRALILHWDKYLADARKREDEAKALEAASLEVEVDV